MLIRLSEEFRTYTDGLAEYDTQGRTVKECCRQLFNRFPQLLVHLQDEDSKVLRSSGSKLNGEYLIDETAPDIRVTESDVFELTRDIPYGENKTVRFIIGAVMFIVGFALMFTPFAAWGPGLMVSGLKMMYDAATEQGIPQGSIADNSTTYTFDGAQNTTASGIPAQIVYGTHRVAGHVLNLYTETLPNIITWDDRSYQELNLYLQLGLCEGEVAGIDDVFVDGYPVRFYNSIKTAPSAGWFNLGGTDQPVMPAFAQTENSTSMNRKVGFSPSVPTVTPSTTTVPLYGYIPTGAKYPMTGNYHPVGSD